jgi:hypothetical protein
VLLLRLRGDSGFERGSGGGVATLHSTMGDSAFCQEYKVRIYSSLGFHSLLFEYEHFIMFAQPSFTVLKFFSQHNVLVGAFSVPPS